MLFFVFLEVDACINFEPTPEIPALQFFEGVDMNGMAMKAGLRPGDYLLEVNKFLKLLVSKYSHEFRYLGTDQK